MLGPSHVAASSSTHRVPAETSERAPPISPAIEVGPCSSSISTVCSSSVRAWPSSVCSCSPRLASRTTSRPPATRSRSKACIGWPVSSIT